MVTVLGGGQSPWLVDIHQYLYGAINQWEGVTVCPREERGVNRGSEQREEEAGDGGCCVYVAQNITS